MIYLKALKLKNEIKQRRLELYNLVNQKGIKDPNVLVKSQELDKKVVELQIIMKYHAEQVYELYEESATFDMELLKVYNERLAISS